MNLEKWIRFLVPVMFIPPMPFVLRALEADSVTVWLVTGTLVLQAIIAGRELTKRGA